MEIDDFDVTFWKGQGRGKPRIAEVHHFTQLSLEDMKGLKTGHTVQFLTRQGSIGNMKVTSVKTWKTRPNNIRLGLKYGLYEYSYAAIENGEYSGEILVQEKEEV